MKATEAILYYSAPVNLIPEIDASIFKITTAAANVEYQFRLFLPTDCVIDWGDNSSDNIQTSDATYDIGHVYETPGVYTVIITGIYNGYRQVDSTYAKLVTEAVKFQSDLVDMSSMYQDCSNLEIKVQKLEFPVTVKWLSSCFLRCLKVVSLNPFIMKNSLRLENINYIFRQTGITEIPESFEFPDTAVLQNLHSVFAGCNNLMTFHENFRLPPYGVIYSSFFQSCQNLASDISHVFDDFTGNRKNVYGIFEHCEKITGTAPADILWNNTDITWTNNTYCFRNCTQLTNYDDIPAEWK